MDSERYKTEDLYVGDKKTLFEKHAPVVRILEEIEEILMPGEERLLTEEYFSLKQLFSRVKMDELHVTSEKLWNLALSMLTICDKIAQKKITPGFYDIADIYTNLDAIYITHPERFQILQYEQDYEWYPEEEKLFGDCEILGDGEQEIADCRLIYKILVAGTKGNVKVPPRMNEADYASVFYQKLSPELKKFLENPKEQTREQMRTLIEKMIAQAASQEKSFHSMEQGEPLVLEKEQSKEGGIFSCMYLILRTNINQSAKIGKLLYDVQEQTETMCQMAGQTLYQSFVLGDGTIRLRKMKEDASGFRIQLKNRIRNYSAGEAIIIAADYLTSVSQYWKDMPDAVCQCVILYEGELQNSPMFQLGVERLLALKERGIHFHLVSDIKYSGEACQRLEQLLERQEDHYVARASESI